MLVRSKKTLASGPRTRLVQLMRPAVPTQTTTGEWTMGDPVKLADQYAEIQQTRGADDYGSHEYEPDNALTLTMYNYTTSEDLTISDYILLNSKPLRIQNVQYLDNGEMIVKCIQS